MTKEEALRAKLKTYNKGVFFDTETTDINKNYIITLSYRVYERGKEPIVGEIRCNPHYPINPNASKVNGFTDEIVQDYEDFDIQWAQIEPYFRDAIWFGHNVSFDIKALMLEFKRYNIKVPHHYVVDTLTAARTMLKKNVDIDNHKLITLCNFFNLEIDEDKFHGSAYDIEMTEMVYRELRKLNHNRGNRYNYLFIPKEVEGDYGDIALSE